MKTTLYASILSVLAVASAMAQDQPFTPQLERMFGRSISIRPGDECTGCNSVAMTPIPVPPPASSPIPYPPPVLGGFMTPTQSYAAPVPQNYTFTFTSSGSILDIGFVNVLQNNLLDASASCYIAYSRPDNLLYLLNNAGTGYTSTTPGMGRLSNSQCTIDGTQSSVLLEPNQIILKLNLLYIKPTNSIFWLATRVPGDVSPGSGWLISGIFFESRN